jgi:TnpA family transposase
VIAANASEAAHVLDGLLHHESSLAIREHYTDTGGATEHVFGLCHLLGFRFAPRLRDLSDRRLYVVDRPSIVWSEAPSIFEESRKTGTRPSE